MWSYVSTIQPSCFGPDDDVRWRANSARQPDRRSFDVESPLAAASRCSPARVLSAHEVAALLLLACTSVEAFAATPDIAALNDLGLARVFQSTEGDRIVLTESGHAVLRMLTAQVVPECRRRAVSGAPLSSLKAEA